jgi:serine/threonine protein phosphatase PrpC
MNTLLSFESVAVFIAGLVLGVWGLAFLARLGAQASSNASASKPRLEVSQSRVQEDSTPSVNAPSVPSGSVLADLATTVFERTDPSGKVRQQCLIGSLRGSAHVAEGAPRQDAFATFIRGDWTAFVVLDGVSSAEESHVGSTFLAQAFERFFTHQFPDGPTADTAEWAELRTSLSQHLVSLHVSKEKQAGRQVDGSVDSLRTQALRRYATTLEALFVRSATNSDGSSDFVYARLAGDGSLFSITQDSFSCLTLDASLSNYPKGPVGALPAYDGEVLLIRESVQPGTTLALVTDGLGDHVDTCDSFKQGLAELSSSSNVSHEMILRFLGTYCMEAGDDRTLAMVRCK